MRAGREAFLEWDPPPASAPRRPSRLGRWLKALGLVAVGGFALIGLGLTAGFAAVRLGWTKAGGRIDLNDRYFQTLDRERREAASAPCAAEQPDMAQILRRLAVLQEFHPDNARYILAALAQHPAPDLAARMLDALELYLKDDPTYLARLAQMEAGHPSGPYAPNAFPWMETEDWRVFREAVKKDQTALVQASEAAGVEPRLVVTMMVSEQMRLFHSERERFKQCFAPLKILGNETKFSLGVCGIKSETGRLIERNLKDPASPCYLGPGCEHLLDYTADELREGSVEDCRFNRLTDRNHYYAYLYTALFIRQIEKQWQDAGFDLSRRPEILATLFNIGFTHSTPRADPQVGGTPISLGGRAYTFGSFAYEFYYSGDLAKEFPYS